MCINTKSLQRGLKAAGKPVMSEEEQRDVKIGHTAGEPTHQ